MHESIYHLKTKGKEKAANFAAFLFTLG